MKFCYEQVIQLPRRAVFGFFQKPRCLAVLHAGWSPLRLLRHEPMVRVGGETWVEQMLAGFVPVVLGFRHTIYEEPVRFAEELIHGSFAHFRHVHEFEEDAGGTLIRDVLDVEWPWHFGGSMALRRVLAPSFARIFRSRAQAMERLVRDGAIEHGAATGCAGEIR